MKSKPKNLTRAEVCQIKGLKAQEELARREYQDRIGALQSEMRDVCGEIEARLPIGNISGEYDVDLDGLCLVPKMA